MVARTVRRLLLAAGVVLVAGCSTAPSRFYTLDSIATSDGAPAAGYTVLVGPVAIPASVDRPEIVVQSTPYRVDIDEFNRWAAPLNDSIARVIAGDLSQLLGTPDVGLAPLANFDPAYRVTIDVQRFDSIPGQAATVDALWAVRQTATGNVRSGRTVARETVEGPGYEALAQAHSRALAMVSGDIAAAIRASARR
jgi:uncharacterized lipoprotein YmbA